MSDDIAIDNASELDSASGDTAGVPPLDDGSPGAESSSDPALRDPTLEEIEAAIARETGLDTTTSEPAEKPDAAPEKKPEPAKAEPKKPEEPKPEDDKGASPKESALIRSLKKREAKLVADTQAFRQQQEGVVAQLREAEQRIVAREQRVTALEQREREAAVDPIAYLQKYHGHALDELGRRLLNDGKAPPEDEARRTAEEARREAKAARDELAREREARTAAEQVAQARAANQQFARGVRAAAEEFPTLNRVYEDDAELIGEALAVDATLRTAGHNYTQFEIAKYLERREARRYGKATAGDQTPSAAGQSQAGRTATKSQSQGNGARVENAETPAGPALTNKATAGRATVPIDNVEMDPDEERAHLIRVAEEARLHS